jgi:signal transduction histidine kinase
MFLVLLLGLACTGAVSCWIKLDSEHVEYLKFINACNDIELQIIHRLSDKEQTLLGAAAMFDALPEVTRQDFKNYVTRLFKDKNFDAVPFLSFVQWIKPEQVSQHENSLRKTFADYRIQPEGKRDAYTAVIYIEPFEQNFQLLGKDMYSEPLRHAAMEQARNENEITVSKKVILIGEKETSTGVVMFAPVFEKKPLETLEQRKNALFGWVHSVVRLNDLMSNIVNVHAVQLHIYDGNTERQENLLYQSANNLPENVNPLFSVKREMVFNGTIWVLRFEQFTPLNLTNVLIAGSLGTLISFLFFLLVRAHFIMQERAAELAIAHDENEILNRQVNQMQKIDSIQKLTAGVAHEFNNILACMLGYNEINKLISEDVTNEALKSDFENNANQIDVAGRRAARLIEKMLIYCRYDSIKEHIKMKPTLEIIRDTLMKLSPSLSRRIKIELELNYDKNIEIDASDLRQIITNLVTNAQDAMKEQDGVITITLNTVTDLNTYCTTCGAMIEGDFIELKVSDNGTGIDERDIDKIFDPFFTTKEVHAGTGLGLSTVQGMVRNSGGHILVESKLGEGTAFSLLFPLTS